jgi:predicted acylesterase/phospholipase RssA
MAHIPPLRLVLSGGGVRGISYVGCFIELEKRNLLKRVNEILAVSCGAMFGFAFSIGYSPNELKEFVEKFDFTLMQDVEPELVFDFLENYGIDSTANFERLLESILKHKGFSTNLTFNQHYNITNFRFRCFATNLYNCEYTEFSYKETPKLRIIDAILASSCVPGYFIPKEINNVLYVDGGIVNNFPIDLLTYDELKDTLGFTFSEEHVIVNNIPSLGIFFNQLFACFYMPRKKMVLNIYKKHIIVVSCGEYPLWNFAINNEDKQKLLDIGKKSVEDFFNLKQFSIAPKRRYSVS